MRRKLHLTRVSQTAKAIQNEEAALVVGQQSRTIFRPKKMARVTRAEVRGRGEAWGFYAP